MGFTTNSPAPASSPRERRILDIRPAEEFTASHLPGAVSHPVTPPPPGAGADAHFERELPSIFLPPREVPLQVVGSVAGLATALAVHLQGRGRAPVSALAFGDLPRATVLVTGASRGHLWQPPPWLSAHAGLLPPPVKGRVLDLACGSGRAAVWLAERGYRVVGVDWQPEALALGRRLAASRRVSVAWRLSDLRQPAAWPPGPWAVVLNFRYLQRDLLRRLATELVPGGVAFVRTFRAAPGYVGHPQPRHRLVAGELCRAFPAGLCEILAHEESHDPDGRPAAGIVARRLSC
jgi:SAM-dependent methyltransferase